MASLGSAVAGPSPSKEELLTGHFPMMCCLRCFQKMSLKEFCVNILLSRQRKIILLKEGVLLRVTTIVLKFSLKKILQ